MDKVSIIIPSHNRPELLKESISSIVDQTYKDWEIIIVDDGSDPPVDSDSLRAEFSENIIVVRNDYPVKQPYARDQGVQSATGEYVIHLDDDDLLAPNAVERALSMFYTDNPPEVIFLGAKGFGDNTAYFDNAQSVAIKKVIKLGCGSEVSTNVIKFGHELFNALLRTVPVAFQRVMEKRSVWNSVTNLRRRVYLLDPGITDENDFMHHLQPPLRESEWPMYAAATCTTMLLNEPLYLVRCNTQRYFSIPDKMGDAIANKVDIMEHLNKASITFDEFKFWQPQIKSALADTYLEHSYYLLKNNSRKHAFHSLLKAILLKPCLNHLRFAIRMLLPVTKK